MTLVSTASRIALALAAGLAFAPAAALAQANPPAAAAEPVAADPEKVLARVGDVTITEADVAQANEDFGDELQQIPQDRRRGVLIDVLVDMELLAKAAREKGLDKTAEFERRMDMLRTRALRNLYVESEIVGSVTDAEIKAEYDAEVAKYASQEEAHARHILVETEEEARAVIASLESGGDFAAIAKEKSKDPGSGANGGDLGFFRKGQMVPEFEAAVFSLEPGGITKEPVQSQFGWHVIKLEEKRQSAPPPLEDVKEQVKSALLRQKFETTMSELRANTSVEIAGEPQPGSAGAPEAPAGDAERAPQQPN